jgi:redox-sensitive bicupin YhaK (pirin superfamily)
VYLDVMLPAGGRIELPALAEELAVYSVGERLHVGEGSLEPCVMGVLPAGQGAAVHAPHGARFVVIGGAALDAPRHMWWNFVSSRKERIIAASEDWEAQRMGHVPGETEFIPLPPTRFTPAEPLS